MLVIINYAIDLNKKSKANSCFLSNISNLFLYCCNEILIGITVFKLSKSCFKHYIAKGIDALSAFLIIKLLNYIILALNWFLVKSFNKGRIKGCSSASIAYFNKIVLACNVYKACLCSLRFLHDYIDITEYSKEKISCKYGINAV